MRQQVLLSMVALGLVAVGVTATGFRPVAIPVAYLAAVTPWLVAIDLREHRLPNALVLPAIGVGLSSIWIEWAMRGTIPFVSLIAGGAYAAFLLLMHVVGGMGMGDVKLGAALGFASWNVSVVVLSPVIAFLVGGLVAVALLVAGNRGRRIAFGPYLLGGYWVAVGLVVLAKF